MIMLEEGSGMDKVSRKLRPKKISRRSVPGEQKRAAGPRQLKRTKVQLRSIIEGLETSNRRDQKRLRRCPAEVRRAVGP